MALLHARLGGPSVQQPDATPHAASQQGPEFAENAARARAPLADTD
jgi:hypothetical protein